MPAKKPVSLIKAEGKSHFSKKELEERQAREIKPNTDNIKPPDYLRKGLHGEFKYYAKELYDAGLMTNLDVDCLSRYLIAKDHYIRLTNIINDMEVDENNVKEYSLIALRQDTFFNQCKKCGMELGLSIGSRAKLSLPQADKKDKKTDEEKLFGDKLG